jgi:hypothetical protein
MPKQTSYLAKALNILESVAQKDEEARNQLSEK